MLCYDWNNKCVDGRPADLPDADVYLDGVYVASREWLAVDADAGEGLEVQKRDGKPFLRGDELVTRVVRGRFTVLFRDGLPILK